MKRFLIFLLTLFEMCALTTTLAATHSQVDVTDESLMEKAIALIKRYEGLHTAKKSSYVGYGHRLQPGEQFTIPMSEETADSLLRVDLLSKCAVFRRFGSDSLLLGVLAYNVGEYRLLGHRNQPKSRLIEKLETGQRDVRAEYVSFRKWNGRIISSIERRRNEEFDLLFGKN